MEYLLNLSELEKHVLWEFICKDIEEEKQKLKAMSGR